MMNNMPPEVSKYFKSGRKRAVSVQPMPEYRVLVRYQDGAARLYSIDPPQMGTYAALRSPDIFQRVYIDESGAIAWDINPDLDSATHWDNHVDFCADNIYIYGEAVN